MSALEQDLDEQDLAEFLAGPDPDYTADPEPPQDADEANRRLRRLARIRADIAQVEETASRQIDQINAWAERRYEVLHARARWEQAGLEMWHRAVLAEDPSRKTISLPCGTLKSRVQQPAWVFDDEVFCAWAKEHAPDLVRVRLTPERTEAKKALSHGRPDFILDGEEAAPAITDEGEVVPGVLVRLREPSFSVVTEEVDR